MPHAVCCAILGVSFSWFYKWIDREATERGSRRAEREARAPELFEASGRTYGSPCIHADLLAEGQTGQREYVAESVRPQGLQGRKPKRRRGLTKQESGQRSSRTCLKKLQRLGI